MDELAEQVLAASGTAESLDSLVRVLRMTTANFVNNPSYDDAMALARLAVDVAAAAERNRSNLEELVSTVSDLYQETTVTDEVNEGLEEAETANLH